MTTRMGFAGLGLMGSRMARHYLDKGFPLTGSKLGAEKGTLLLMTGGRRETHDELMPVMMAIGTKAVYCGEVGQASLMKLIGNTMISFSRGRTRRSCSTRPEASGHPCPAAIRDVFQTARAQGWGGEDIAAVFKVLESAAGLKGGA